MFYYTNWEVYIMLYYPKRYFYIFVAPDVHAFIIASLADEKVLVYGEKSASYCRSPTKYNKTVKWLIIIIIIIMIIIIIIIIIIINITHISKVVLNHLYDEGVCLT